ncbi:MAG: hypothetical protein HQL27_01530 [Candidatus Omnitrophica bacterium]|nr:hypothetical protein [Candidatus Omnitrophota bacterium]
MKARLFSLFPAFFLLFFIGCGYTTKSNLSGSLRTVYVDSFENKVDFTSDGNRNIYLPLLEVKLRNEVISRYQFDGNLRVGPEAEADLVLKGSLKNYEREGLRYTDNDDVEEYLVRVTADLELKDNRNGNVLWTETNFAGEKSYFVTGVKATSEETAISGAITDLARRIVERTIENW